jgi:hypothetical protein
MTPGCRNMAELFSDQGYAITAEGGDIAVEKALQEPSDLGSLSLRMPC